MSKFKIGDKVRCTTDTVRSITSGKEYKVYAVGSGSLWTVDDFGDNRGFDDIMFKLAQPDTLKREYDVKKLKDMSFDELVKECVMRDLDALVKGEPMASRVRYTADIALRWRVERDRDV